MTCDVVLNPADPDATYNKHGGVGYLVQVMETYSPDAEPDDPAMAETTVPAKPDLITHVAVGPMNVHDGAALVPALEDSGARGIRPAVVLADSHFGSEENLKQAAGRGVEVVAPAMPAKGSKQEKLTLEHFELDGEGLIVHCPQGHVPVATSGGEGKIQALFDVETCTACPLSRACCASAAGRSEARYQYTRDRVRHRERRLRDQSAEFRERYRWRAGIEGTMSRFKHQLGMARLRVRGPVAYVTFLLALGMNIHRVAVYRAAC